MTGMIKEDRVKPGDIRFTAVCGLYDEARSKFITTAEDHE